MTESHERDSSTGRTEAPPGVPRWVRISGLVVLIVAVVLVVVMLVVGGEHGPRPTHRCGIRNSDGRLSSHWRPGSRVRLRSGSRKLVLSIHLVVSVGWIGALAAYLAMDIATVASGDPGTLRAAYVGMDLIVRTVIVPLAIATLTTGMIISLSTRWGLFRHYWVVISLVLTIVATVVLLSETRTVVALAQVAADPATTADELAALASTLVHSIGGMVVLLAILVLNVYKPRGMTRYGWRRQSDRPSNDNVESARLD